jgi:SAM-dependent methyltransferase
VRRSLAQLCACPAPGGARRPVDDELRSHVPVQDHTLGAVCNGGGRKHRRTAGSRGGRALPPPGPALDLGCGRGLYIPELARRGWEAVGIDYVPTAIEAARTKSRGVNGLSYVVGDVAQLPSARLGTFDFFLDIGCFQGLDARRTPAVRLETTGRCQAGRYAGPGAPAMRWT